MNRPYIISATQLTAQQTDSTTCVNARQTLVTESQHHEMIVQVITVRLVKTQKSGALSCLLMHSCSATDIHKQHSVFSTIAFLAFSASPQQDGAERRCVSRRRAGSRRSPTTRLDCVYAGGRAGGGTTEAAQWSRVVSRDCHDEMRRDETLTISATPQT